MERFRYADERAIELTIDDADKIRSVCAGGLGKTRRGAGALCGSAGVLAMNQRLLGREVARARRSAMMFKSRYAKENRSHSETLPWRSRGHRIFKLCGLPGKIICKTSHNPVRLRPGFTGNSDGLFPRCELRLCTRTFEASARLRWIPITCIERLISPGRYGAGSRGMANGRGRSHFGAPLRVSAGSGPKLRRGRGAAVHRSRCHQGVGQSFAAVLSGSPSRPKMDESLTWCFIGPKAWSTS